MSTTELARLDNCELVYGTYEEVENYAEEQDTCVDKYLNHVNPSTVQKAFKYIGDGLCDPYSIAKPIYKFDAEGKYEGLRVFKEKF